MNQTGNKDITDGLEKMISGLDDMVRGLGNLPDDVKKNMTEAEALEFSKKIDEAKLGEHVSSVTTSITELKNIFK